MPFNDQYPVSPMLRELRMEACGINQMEFVVVTNYGEPSNPSVSYRDMTIDEIKDRCRQQSKRLLQLESRAEILDDLSDVLSRLGELE